MRDLANRGAQDLANLPEIRSFAPFLKGDGGPGGTATSERFQRHNLANRSGNGEKSPPALPNLANLLVAL